MANEQINISAGEKDSYFSTLSSFLVALTKGLAGDSDERNKEKLREFGEKNGWDWNRIPEFRDTYKTLADNVEQVRQNYSWFDTIRNPNKVLLNRSYFNEVGISTESGLPWVFDFINLHRLRREVDTNLAKLQPYEDLVANMRSALTEDSISEELVPSTAMGIHKNAMQRNFFEQLKNAELLGWSQSSVGVQNIKPSVLKVLPLGSETLWNLSFVSYLPGNSMFEIYDIDLWQDTGDDLQITEDEGGINVSDSLMSSLRFGSDNATWYVLSSIDEKFENIHPVHVSRAIVGPFENRYQTKPKVQRLAVTADILKANPNSGLFRFSRQYSYAPNHIETRKGLRQVLHRENWSDEIIVCPKGLGAKVANSVLGTDVRVYEAEVKI